MRALSLILVVLAGQAWAEPPRVVADIAPVQSLVAMVMGELGQPDLLLDGTADPHDFHLRPSQARALSRADLLVWMGPDLTPWLDRALGNLAPGAVSLPLLDVPDAPMRIEAHEGEDAGTGSDHDEDHAHGALDPHAWLDPQNAAFYLSHIAEALAGLDPDNANAYRRNAGDAAQRLRALTTDLAPVLDRVRSVILVAGHDELGYFLGRFGLHLTGALSDAAGNAPGVAGLRDLRSRLTAEARRVCLLLEPGAPDSMAEILELTPPPVIARIDILGRDLPPGPELYETVLRDAAAALTGCADALGQ